MSPRPASPDTARREYVVLHSDALLEWRRIGEATGSTDKQAIASVLANDPDVPQDGTFVAVPARSWRPVQRTVQQVQKVLWT